MVRERDSGPINAPAMMMATAFMASPRRSQPRPPSHGLVLSLALIGELPGDRLCLIAPSGRLSAPSITITARVTKLLPQHAYLDGQAGGPQMCLREGRISLCVLGRCTIGLTCAHSGREYPEQLGGLNRPLPARLTRARNSAPFDGAEN
jgi:hypothetical protein